MTAEKDNEGAGTPDIKRWRDLSPEALLESIGKLPQIDKELALKIVAGIPDFKGLVSETMALLENSVQGAQRFSWKSQKQLHKAFESYRDSLNRELESSDLTPESRLTILRMIGEAVDKQAKVHAEANDFQIKLITVAVSVVGVLVAGVVAVATNNKVDLGGDKSA